jgi:hypothetical protein
MNGWRNQRYHVLLAADLPRLLPRLGIGKITVFGAICTIGGTSALTILLHETRVVAGHLPLALSGLLN